ncbi:hypothetical protein [Tsuneonella sp. HG222]
MTRRLVPLAAALGLALAACSDSAEEEPTYEADAVDESGGDLIVRDADEPGVAVDVPETPMTNVPAASDTGTTTSDTETGQTTPPSE